MLTDILTLTPGVALYNRIATLFVIIIPVSSRILPLKESQGTEAFFEQTSLSLISLNSIIAFAQYLAFEVWLRNQFHNQGNHWCSDQLEVMFTDLTIYIHDAFFLRNDTVRRIIIVHLSQ